MLKKHLLVYAGKSSLNKICDDLLLYDICKNDWKKIGLVNRPSARQSAGIEAAGNLVYVFGGRNSIKNEFYNDLWIFNFDKMTDLNCTNIMSVDSRRVETKGQVSSILFTLCVN